MGGAIGHENRQAAYLRSVFDEEGAAFLKLVLDAMRGFFVTA